MSDYHYLLFIDRTPINKELKNYFAQFNITLVQQDRLPPIVQEKGTLLALLIHWSVLNNELQKLHQLYTHYKVPILVISDYPDEEICVQALEAGADDLITNPIYPRELHARISAINRRVLREDQPEQEKEIFVFNNWRLYPSSRRVFNEDTHQELPLSAGEYDLLLTFVQQPQRVLDREFLLQITKNSDLNPFDRRIDVQISRLRQKIEPGVKKPLLIKTIRNEGYLFTASVITIKEVTG
jgi:two-component system OmpR family response regulator